MSYLNHILPVIILAPVLAITHSQNHFLICLLNLEAITLGIISITFILLFNSSYFEILNALIILCLGACEARIGLACLVKIIRKYGNDNTKILNIKYQ